MHHCFHVVFYIIGTQYLHVRHAGKDTSFRTVSKSNGYISNLNKVWRPRPKFKVSFFISFCCFWINVTQINFENIKTNKKESVLIIVSSGNRDLMLMLERPLSHYWTSPLMNEWTMNEWMNEWMNVRMNVRMKDFITKFTLKFYNHKREQNANKITNLVNIAECRVLALLGPTNIQHLQMKLDFLTKYMYIGFLKQELKEVNIYTNYTVI